MKKILASVACLGLWLVAGTALQADNLVLNGGFETGDFTDWTISNASNGSLLTVTPFVSHSGQYSAAFGATEWEFDAIRQSLSTAAGKTYVLSYWVNADTQGQPSNDFQAYWNGALLQDLHSLDRGDGTFAEYSASVTGTGTDVLEFVGYNAASNDYLDDVSVATAPSAPASAPEPASVALLATALLSLGIGKKLRKQ